MPNWRGLTLETRMMLTFSECVVTGFLNYYEMTYYMRHNIFVHIDRLYNKYHKNRR